MNASTGLHRSRGLADIVQVARRAVGVIAIRGGGAVLAFVVQVLLARWMGAAEYGIVTYAWSWMLALGTLASIGFPAAVVRFVPEHEVRGEFGAVRGLLRRSAEIVTVASVLIALVAIGAAVAMADAIAPYYRVPLLVALAAIPLYAILELVESEARGFGWVDLAYAPSVVVRPLVFLILVGGGIALADLRTALPATAMLALSYLLVVLGLVVMFYRRVPHAIRTATPVYETRTWTRVALPLLVYEAGHLVFHFADVMIVGMLLTPEAVAIYNVAARTAGLVILVLYAISAFSVPRFAALHASGDRDGLIRLARQVSGWVFWPSLAIAVVLYLAAEPVLALFGPDFTAGAPIVTVLLAGTLLRSAFGPVDALLNMTGHQDRALVALVPCAVLDIVLCVVLVPSMGPIGAAWATAISFSLVMTASAWIVWRRLGFLVVCGFRLA